MITLLIEIWLAGSDAPVLKAKPFLSEVQCHAAQNEWAYRLAEIQIADATIERWQLSCQAVEMVGGVA